jgi:hypothetical protein
MNDERDVAIANREKIRKLYKPKPQTDKSKTEDAESGEPQANTPAPTVPAATKPLFGGW